MTDPAFRTRTSKEWIERDEILLLDEVGLEADTGFQKVGDGKTSWNWLPYRAAVRSSGTLNLEIGRRTAETLEIVNDTGRGVYLPLANEDAAGLISPQEKKLLTDLPEVAKTGWYNDLRDLPDLGEAAFRGIGAGEHDVAAGNDPRITGALSREGAARLYLSMEAAAKSYQALNKHLGAIAELAADEYGLGFLEVTDQRDAAAYLGLGDLAFQDGKFSGKSSGTNTGDQEIELTGDVTGSGTGKIKAKLNPKAVLAIVSDEIGKLLETANEMLSADDAAKLYQMASDNLESLSKLEGSGFVMRNEDGSYSITELDTSSDLDPSRVKGRYEDAGLELEGVGLLGSDAEGSTKVRLIRVASGLTLKDGVLCVDDKLFAAALKAAS